MGSAESGSTADEKTLLSGGSRNHHLESARHVRRANLPMKNASAFRLWAPVLLLGASSMASVCWTARGQVPQTATQSLLENAHVLEVRGRMDLASQRWQQVLLAEPNNAEALAGLARAARLSGNTASASTYLDRLRAINPNDPEISRIQSMGTAADHNQLLQQAGKLAQQGQYGQSMGIYRQLYGNTPPSGDIALAYYETESATEDGRPHAIAGLRDLVSRNPGDSRFQISLGRILTYNPKTRGEGRRLLSAHPNDPQAAEALRQSLLWDAQNPATAGDIRQYLSRHPDAQLSTILKNEPRQRQGAPTAAERQVAAMNASRTAEDRAAYNDLNAKRLDAAEAKFKAVLAKTPDEGNALAGMGYIRMQQGNFGGAISFLVQARQDRSKDPNLENALATSRFWYTMGEGAIALNEDNLPGAEKQYRIALQMRPTSTEALEGLGGTLLRAQQSEAAIQVFAQFSKLKPAAAHAWRGLFLSQVGSGSAPKALATERLIPAAPRAELAKDPLYLRALASALSSVGRDADAARVLKSALDLPFPSDAKGLEAETQIQYAGLLQQANHLDQASGLFHQILTKDADNIGAWQGLVRVQHAQGNDPEAEKTLESMSADVYSRAMHDNGFDSTVASVYQNLNRLDVAQDVLEKSLQQQEVDGGKPSVPAQIQLAGIYLLRGNAASAYPLYQSVLTQFPDRVEAWKGLLSALHNTARDQEALAQIQQIPAPVRADLEKDVDFLQTVSAIYNGLGQPREAQLFLARIQTHYAALHTAPPADVEVQTAWLMYNGGNESGLYKQLMMLGGRTDLTDGQRRTVQTIWANWAVRRANQAAANDNNRRSLEILNATAQAFPGNSGVIKALAGGYSRAGMQKQAVAIWKSMDMTQAPAADYKAAVGAALASGDSKDAENWLRFGLNQYPKDAQLLVLGARFEQARGDVNRAADYYRASLAAMPAADPAGELASELSRPGPDAPLPGSRSGQDLSTLLAPGMASNDQAVSVQQQTARPSQPYLPGGGPSNANVPVPLGPEYQYNPSAEPTVPGYGTNPVPSPAVSAPATKTRLRDYVPQASVDAPLPADATTLPFFVAEEQGAQQAQFPDVEPVFSLAAFRHRQIVRLNAQALSTASGNAVYVGDQIVRLDSLETEFNLSHTATFRRAAYRQQAQRPLTALPSNGPLTTFPASQSNGPQQAASVYGPYVPYVAPKSNIPQKAKPGQTTSQQPAAPAPAPQVPQPSASEVYGPYTPYAPPRPTTVQIGSNPAVRSIPKPDVTDILPTAKYSGPDKHKPHATQRPDLASARASARRRQSASPSVVTGQSTPPSEDYTTPPTEPVQYNSGAQTALPAQQPTGAVSPVPVYVQPQRGATASVPTTNGDSYGQQYPQPNTGGSTATHRRTRTARAAENTRVANPAPTQGMSYPGVGQTLGSQPLPTIGPAYTLPAAPTDADLMQKQVPPLRGGYYPGPVLASQVPLTERQQAERDLASLESSYSGWLGGTGGARYRSGVVGYDRLSDLETTFEASYVAGNNVRFTVVPKAVFLNSGQFDITNYAGVTGSPVIGTYNSATAAFAPSQQSANGIGGELQATGRNFALALGYTPYEFLVENVTGRALFRPSSHLTLTAGRETVTETQLSYAGLRDPGTATAVYAGNVWGGVVATGGGIRFDSGDEKAGFYISADGASLTGYHVLQNNKFEGTAGAYFLAHTFTGYGKLNLGVSAFGMHYAQNERPLSYGLGGYFSPTAYFLASVPISFNGRYKNNFHYSLQGAVGVQTFQEASQLYFPLDRGVQSGFQTSLNCVTAQIANHTCGQYPENTNTGGNYSLNSEGAYRIADHWFAGGYLSGNNTNNYNTVTGGFFIRYVFRPQFATDEYPTGNFPVEGFRPLRVP